MKQVLFTAVRITADPQLQKNALNEAMRYLIARDLEITPAEIATDLYQITCSTLGTNDPFRAEMDFYNKKALLLYPKLRSILGDSFDPLFQSLLMAVAGNIIDLGLVNEEVDIDGTIDAVLRAGLKVNDYNQLQEDLGEAQTLLYIADNAGEIVFDRLVLEEVKRRYPNVKLTVAVKSGPAVNDALKCDAIAAGIEPIAEIIDTGAECLGIPQTRCSPEFWRSFTGADVVIAKGHANYETTESNSRPVYVLLRAKCDLVATELGVALHDSVLKKLS